MKDLGTEEERKIMETEMSEDEVLMDIDMVWEVEDLCAQVNVHFNFDGMVCPHCGRGMKITYADATFRAPLAEGDITFTCTTELCWRPGNTLADELVSKHPEILERKEE